MLAAFPSVHPDLTIVLLSMDMSYLSSYLCLPSAGGCTALSPPLLGYFRAHPDGSQHSWLRGKKKVKEPWNQAGRWGAEGDPSKWWHQAFLARGTRGPPGRSEEGQKGQVKQPTPSPAVVLRSVHTPLGNFRRPFRILAALCCVSGSPALGPKSGKGMSETGGGPVGSATTPPFCCLEMSSAKHVVSPHSPRPGGQR